ncbi:hypothetical protein Aph02nite_09140 [Actinoplanes philippinensis]|uniref:ABC-type branched-chain amino acid transport system, substrate-binding protein n=1 Tax=Actinoplanes philippinensis TaxID=35752 RepID=A0A1I2AEP3_9ACTN|nr:hypothetical protein [Actinoplanes philippinensis]GIE74964.1 hypothetical protein Aph02nite_09140 [Actinoplanes philippinensis]SFE41463.1 hypothetical protein SAMN05421541_101628 [Actinoplanes philippinensis]
MSGRGRLLRSLLTADVLLRLAAVVLAGLIVIRSLLAGAAGLWSIVLVLASAAALWALLRLGVRVRSVLADATADAPSLPSFIADRPRSRLAAILALLVLIVHAGITGYVGVWTILVTVALAAIATLLSPNLRLVLVLGTTAVVFAAATVFVATFFQGSTEARALAVSLAAVILPVLVSDKLVGLFKQPALTITHQAVLAVLTLLLGYLGWTRADWLPGVMHNCYTLPTSTGITVLRATADGTRCYGLLDTADAGVFAATAFGRDPVTTALERRILAANRPLEPADLTVVWLGALSCDPPPGGGTGCADGRDYPSERDQLRAMLFAQKHIEDTTDHRLHVVIADATQDVRHAGDIAKMIIEQRDALGPRLVVIGGGDSRDTTQTAISSLLGAGIPFIAPNLLADFGAPGRPFVDRAGYLQLAPPNLEYATDTAVRLSDEFPDGYRLDIYQQPNATDLYTTSLVNDLLAAVAPNDRASTRHLPALDRIDETICDDTDGPPTVVYFADRWTRFADFVQRIKEVCGHARPRLVIADGSVSRFMANYQMRAVSMADWPVDYYVGGPGCSALTESSLTVLTGQIQHFHDLFGMAKEDRFTCADRAPEAAASGELRDACTLDAAAKMTSQPCLPNDLGGFLLPAWDAVVLADALLPNTGRDSRPAPADYLAGLKVTDLQLSTTGSMATVTGGRLVKATVPVLLWHVDPLNDPARVWERPSPTLLLPAEKTP